MLFIKKGSTCKPKKLLFFLGLLFLLFVVAFLTTELDGYDQVIEAEEVLKSYRERCQDPTRTSVYSLEVDYELGQEKVRQLVKDPSSIFQKIGRVLLFSFFKG